MKRFFLAASLMMPGVVLAQSFDYELSLYLKSAKRSAKAYLISNYSWTHQKVLDSVLLKNGKARFTGTLAEPVRVHLVLDHTGTGIKNQNKDDAIELYLEEGKTRLTGTDSLKTARLNAGKITRELHAYTEEVMAHVREAQRQPAPPPGSLKGPRAADSLLKVFAAMAAKTDTMKWRYIRNHPESYMSLVALKELAGKDIDVAMAAPLFNGLSASIRETASGRDFAKKLEEARLYAVGAMAPDFTQNDVNGQPVKLSDFRGRYVLVDFWASWCVPCRMENPNLVKAFHTYKDKNFAVLGISLDNAGKKSDWLAAIEKDGLAWTNVSDLKGRNNEAAALYKVRSIPQNFLIDPTGKIVAKNLRGERLHKELARILP